MAKNVGIFNSPYVDVAGMNSKMLNGNIYKILSTIDQPDEHHDAEVLPLYLVRCNGKTFEAYPEELEA